MSKSLKNTQSPEIGGARSASRYAQEIRQTVSNLHDTARRRTLGAGEEPHRRQVTGKTRLPTHGDIGLKEQRDAFNIYVFTNWNYDDPLLPLFGATIERRTREMRGIIG
jgi:hypothetical protein